MTPEEHRALDALELASMRLASSGKRFRKDMSYERDIHRASNRDFKMTRAQAKYLWLLVDLYRRQVKDERLRSIAAHVKLTGELPAIYLEGDHREPVRKRKSNGTQRAKPVHEGAADRGAEKVDCQSANTETVQSQHAFTFG